jgi:hypothetical protein
MSFLRPLGSFIGVFQGLLGKLVSVQVVFFVVARGGGTVRVCGEFVEFGGPLVRVVWHGASLSVRGILESFDFPGCPIRDTRPTMFSGMRQEARRKAEPHFRATEAVCPQK